MRLTQPTEYQIQTQFAELLAATQDRRSRRSCENCRFNSRNLCTQVPSQETANFYAANDCHDWQSKSV